MRLTAKEQTGQNISAIPNRLYKVEHFCYSAWVVPRIAIQSKGFLADYNISTKPRQLCMAEIFLLFCLFLNQDKCYPKSK